MRDIQHDVAAEEIDQIRGEDRGQVPRHIRTQPIAVVFAADRHPALQSLRAIRRQADIGAEVRQRPLTRNLQTG